MAAEHPGVAALYNCQHISSFSSEKEKKSYISVGDIVNLKIVWVLALVLCNALAIGGDEAGVPFLVRALGRAKVGIVSIHEVVEVWGQGRLVQSLGISQHGARGHEGHAKEKRRGSHGYEVGCGCEMKFVE